MTAAFTAQTFRPHIGEQFPSRWRAGRSFELRIGQAVVKAGARDGVSGSLGVLPGTYRVTESAAGGGDLSNYSTSIACTLNGSPTPSVRGRDGSCPTVTLAVHDKLACTLTNRRKATITVTKHSPVPSSDTRGRFDLKVGGAVVAASAGDGGVGLEAARSGDVCGGGGGGRRDELVRQHEFDRLHAERRARPLWQRHEAERERHMGRRAPLHDHEPAEVAPGAPLGAPSLCVASPVRVSDSLCTRSDRRLLPLRSRKTASVPSLDRWMCGCAAPTQGGSS